jgi:Uma2 family endonuclease
MKLAEKKYRHPPRTGMKVFMMLPEGTWAELINDGMYISPTPNYLHQELNAELLTQVRNSYQKNNIGNCLATIDVFFNKRNVFRPDILFIAKENPGIVKHDKIKGSPDLIIEILSPGNRKHDTEKKKTAYKKLGVKEYFIVDPVTKATITYYLTGEKYRRQKSQKRKITSKLLKKTFIF